MSVFRITPSYTQIMKILILNGPNLNLLGSREPELYGESTLDDVHALCVKTAHALGLEADCFQSNHEGELIDKSMHTASYTKRAQPWGRCSTPVR